MGQKELAIGRKNWYNGCIHDEKRDKTMKKYIVLMLTILLCCALCACEEGPGTTLPTSQPAQPTTPTTDPTEPTEHIHAFGEWTVVMEQTCTERGVEISLCACGEYESRAIAADGHSFSDWVVTKAASCAENGEEARACTCGETETREIEATGHVYSGEVTAPACTERGYTTYTCECGDSYVADYVDATGHSFGEWSVTKEANCTQKGEETSNCSCGETEIREMEATGHHYGDWAVTKAASCTENGEEARTCTCGETETREIEATGHVYSGEVTAPACTERGYTTYTCECGDSYVADYVDATGHSFGNWVVIKEATETETGEQIRRCDCGETETGIIPVIVHISGEWIVTKEATCTQKGEETRTCSCGETETREMEALGHDRDANHKCARCGNVGGTCGENLIWELENGVLTISGTGDMMDYDAVKNQAAWAWNGANTIVLEEGVTGIGKDAFVGCYNLKRINLPTTLTKIGTNAFCDNRSIDTYIADLVAWNNLSLGDYNSDPRGGGELYLNGGRIVHLVIPEGVTEIRAGAFSGCKSIISITIPDSVTNIGASAFSSCSGLTEVTLPSSVTCIGYNAFAQCGKLSRINIPNSIAEIQASAFRGCTSLKRIDIDDIAAWCGIQFGDAESNPLSGSTSGTLYCNGSAVTELVIPSGVTAIADYAFAYGSTMTSVVIPDAVTRIGVGAFMGCSGLTEVIIPQGVTAIESSTFSGCSSLTKIQIPDGVTTVSGSAFADCTSLTEISLPDSVTRMGAAFSGCTSLVRFVIPQGVTTIEDYTFKGCRNLTDLIIPSGLTEIKGGGRYFNGAFVDCTSLTNIYISDLVAWNNLTIGGYFSDPLVEGEKVLYLNGVPIVNLVIPEGIVTIREGAFKNCTNISSVTIPGSVKNINSTAFGRCTGLNTIVFQGDVIAIDANAFYQVVATAYYPAGNATWMEAVRQNYGGTITWVAA